MGQAGGKSLSSVRRWVELQGGDLESCRDMTPVDGGVMCGQPSAQWGSLFSQSPAESRYDKKCEAGYSAHLLKDEFSSTKCAQAYF